jgi:hypothetical protein
MASPPIRVVAAVVGAALAAGVAFAVGRRSVDSPETPAAANGLATTTTAASGTVEFRDDKAGWSISYPRSWNRLQPAHADVALVVSEKAPELNTGGSILARTVALAAPVDDATLPAAREVTDALVKGEGLQILAGPKVIRQAGLPGYFYFYSFRDPATGREGVHTHYFLFKGATMISFVFQALPKEDFQGLAPLFDQVLSSFRVL